MKLSSSNGTRKTVEDLKLAAHLISDADLRILEINGGCYSENPPIEFNSKTSKELKEAIKSLSERIKVLESWIV